MRVSRILAPVTALGPGRRVGLWVQGCNLGCAGCVSTDTWPVDGGRELAVAAVVDELLRLIRTENLTGLTVSGGEPLQQVGDVARVIGEVRNAAPEVDVLLFTGYRTNVARRRAPEIFELVDVIVAGPYDQNRVPGGALVASDNQEFCVLTERGRQRFANLPEGQLQLAAAEGELQLIGIPRPGELDRLTEDLQRAGITLEEVSWRR